jgi:hypothetical protein
VNGSITGVRFFKSTPSNSGTHVAHLWSATGQQLASATFTNETGTGWQQVSFDVPVGITANTTYVVSYYAPSGHYAGTDNYFGNLIDRSPLFVPAGTAGVYKYGSSGFPTQSFQRNNYWVDVVFKKER